MLFIETLKIYRSRMHKIKIDKETIDAAVIRRGGRQFAFADIDPMKTALIVIDMQNYFLEPGMAAEVSTAREIVPNINIIADVLREAGGKVAWVVSTFDEDIFEKWSVMKDLFSPERRAAMIDNLSTGAHGHGIWPELLVDKKDWTVQKNRFSALVNGSSNLEARLKEAGVDTLIIAGTLTDVCCESTARDAMMLNFKVVMVSDANAAACDDDHNAALNAMARLFTDVISTDDLIERLR
tara:strand:- start:46617 stop:47333 length:717 start_codon:yes stop_codon:yes gene_type:complete